MTFLCVFLTPSLVILQNVIFETMQAEYWNVVFAHVTCGEKFKSTIMNTHLKWDLWNKISVRIFPCYKLLLNVSLIVKTREKRKFAFDVYFSTATPVSNDWWVLLKQSWETQYCLLFQHLRQYWSLKPRTQSFMGWARIILNFLFFTNSSFCYKETSRQFLVIAIQRKYGIPEMTTYFENAVMACFLC